MKPILEAIIGGIAVIGKSNKDIVSQIVEHFSQNEKFNLVIAPEATRAKTGEVVKPIGSGFWHLLKQQMSLLCWCTQTQKLQARRYFWKNLPNRPRSWLLVLIKALYKEHVGLDIEIPEPKTAAQ